MWPLLLVLAAGAVSLTLWAYRQTWPQPSVRLGRILTALRATALVLLVLAVAGPVVSRLSEMEDRAGLVIVLEDSASMGLSDGGETPGPGLRAPDRWTRSLTLVAQLDSALAVTGKSIHKTFLRGNGLAAVREFSLNDPDPGAPFGQGTDLVRLRGQALEQLAGRPLRAVVMFSDGQETVGRDLATTSDKIAGRAPPPFAHHGLPVPFIAVGVGDPRGPADRIVKDLRYPGTVYQGDEAVVEMAVAHRFTGDLPLPPVTARLYGPAGVVAEVTAPVDGEVVQLELAFKPAATGLQVYRLEVSPLGNERFLENNQASLAINVRQERSALLLLCERPSWDVRFLAQAAAREQRLSLSVVYANPGGLVYADSLTPWREPTSAAGWSVWDGVILVGWSGKLADLDWARLRVAAQAGLGLLVLPGDGVAGSSEVLVEPAGDLVALLPVSLGSRQWRTGPHSLFATGNSWSHSVLEGIADSAGSGSPGLQTVWNDLPPLRQVLDTEPRPGAQILLAARSRSRTGQPVGELPVLAVSGSEPPRIAWFGGRNLWELAFWEPERPGDRERADPDQIARKLMRNLLVWTAEGEQEKELVFSGRRNTYQEGETIRLASLWRDLRGQPVTGRRLSLTLRALSEVGEGAAERTFPLTELGGQPGSAEVELPPLPPGAYTVQLVGQGEVPVMSRQESLVVARHSIEATQVRQDPRRLRQLAAGLGDHYVDGHDPEALGAILGILEGLDWSSRLRKTRTRLDVLSSWPFLTTVTLLLGLEWFLRRRNGML